MLLIANFRYCSPSKVCLALQCLRNLGTAILQGHDVLLLHGRPPSVNCKSVSCSGDCHGFRGNLDRAIMQKGTLSSPNGKLNLQGVYRCLIDVAAGMDYLHSLGVINGDLKPANILLKSTDADPRGFTCKVQSLSWTYGHLLAWRLLVQVPCACAGQSSPDSLVSAIRAACAECSLCAKVPLPSGYEAGWSA